ncbi:MAG: hypothetical protein Q7I95_01090, partial [Thiobacillus sp.]|nr:hypothetical protein [Thiobacillus sp.]
METMPNTKSPSNTGSENTAAEHARRSLDEARASADSLAAQGSEAIHKGTAHAREVISHTT